jgi:hypothetical protein
MIVWLDHRIFGNGYGLKSPYFDDKFYWLSGELYTWGGWFGAQLQSFQWRHPKAGERRTMLGREFRALHSTREWLWVARNYIFGFPLPIARVRVAWSYTALPTDLDEANAELRRIQAELANV